MSSLEFSVGIDATQLQRELARLNKKMSEFSRNVKTQGDQIDSTLKKIGAGVATYFSFAAAKGFLNEVINVRGEFQQLDIALTTMLGNKEKSDKLMNQIVTMAAKTPFSLTEISQGAKQLLAFQVPAEKTVDTLTRLGNIAAGVSAPVGELIRAYGQVKAKGRLQAEEINQFAEKGVPLIAELAKELGVTNAQVLKLSENGKIGFNELNKVIENLTNEGGMFFNLMEKQAGSLPGLVSNLGDAFDRMLNKIGQSNQGIIADGIRGLTTLVENYEEVIDVLKVIVATYGAYKGALLAVQIAQKAQAVIGNVQAWLSLAKSIRNAKDAQIAFNLATKSNPIGLIAGAVALAITSLAVFANKTKDAMQVSEDFKNELNSEIGALKDRFKAAKESASGTDAHRKAIEELNSKYGDYLGNMLSEKSSLEDIEKAQNKVTEAIAKSMALKAKEDQLTKIKESTTKVGTGYSQAVSSIFGNRNKFTAEQEGKAIAALDKLREKSKLANVGTLQIRDALKQAGVEADIGGLAYRKLFENINKYIIATNDEKTAMSDLDKVYQSYLETLWLVGKKEEENKNNNTDGGNTPAPFDLKAFKKQLDDQKKAYEEYLKTQKGARAGDEESVQKYYSNLIKQGKNYEEYLQKQLEKLRNNVAAKNAIYQKAASEGINLNTVQLKPQKTNSTVPKSVTGGSIPDQQLAAMDAAIVRIKKAGEEISNATGKEKIKQLGSGLVNAAFAMQGVADAAGRFDEELGASLMDMANLTGAIGNLFAGNYLQGSIQLLKSIADLTNKSAMKQQQIIEQNQKIEQSINSQNESLRRQLDLINQIAGSERLSTRSDTIAGINKDIDTLIRNVTALNNSSNQSGTGIALGGSGRVQNSDQLNQEILNNYLNKIQENYNWAKNGNLVGGLSESDWKKALDYATQINELYKQRDELINKQQEELTGNTYQGIVDSIMQGFSDGELSAQEFGDTFEGIMKNAVLNSIKLKYLEQPLKEWYDQFASASKGGLTKQEIDTLRGSLQTTMQDAQTKVKDMTDIFKSAGVDVTGSEGSDSNKSLTGSIQGVTEETATVLGGQMNAMRMNQAESLSLMNQSLRHLSEIASNTSHLLSIDKKLDVLGNLTSRKTESSSKSIDTHLKARGF